MTRKTKMSKEYVSVKRHERMSVALLLAMAGGYMDIYTYLVRDGVFANAETGNIVLLGLSIAQGNWNRLLNYLFPIVAYFTGVLLTDWMKYRFERRHLLACEHLAIILEAVLLFLVGFAGPRVPNELVTVTISFICAVQAHTFRKVHNLPYASTMCTGNLRSAAENLFAGLIGRNPHGVAACMKYLGVIGFFTFGAMIGAVVIKYWKHQSIWVCCVLLLAALVLLLKSEKSARQI